MTDALAAKAADPRSVLTGSIADHSEGMSYLETLPRRLVTVYLPLSIIMLVLLFPFYWMAAHRPSSRTTNYSRWTK